MADPVIRWYDDDDVAESGELQFLDAVGGIATAAQEKHIWNDKGGTAGADTAREVEIWALSRDVGETEYSLDDDAARDGWLEGRLISQAGTGIEAQTTAWMPLGKAKKIFAKDIPSNTTRHIELRMVAPASAGTVSKEFLVRLRCQRADTPLDMGHFESGARGVRTGLGDPDFTELLEGYALTETGTPDEFVNVALGRRIAAGIPVVDLAHQIEFTNLDSASAALAAGQSYWAAITAGADTAALTVTKGLKGTSPLSVSDRPALPSGERLVGWVEVPYGLAIATANITQTDRLYGCYAYTASGLNVTLHRGQSMADNRLIVHTGKAWEGALDASSTVYLWQNADGTFSTDLTGDPLGRGELLWVFTTDGSGITGVADRRRWLAGGELVVIQLGKAGTLAVNDEVFGMLPSNQRALIRPIGGITVGLADDGATSGATLVDVFAKAQGGAFTTLFTSSGTDDQRPSIAYNATDPIDVVCAPEVLVLEPWSQLKAKVMTVPGTASSGLTVSIVAELH